MKIPRMDLVKSKESTTMSLSKTERKAQIQERKRLLKVAWSSLSESSKQEDAIEVLEIHGCYTTQNGSIILQSPKREKPKTIGVS